MTDVFPTCPGCNKRVCCAEDSGKEIDGVYWCGGCLIRGLEAKIVILREFREETGSAIKPDDYRSRAKEIVDRNFTFEGTSDKEKLTRAVLLGIQVGIDITKEIALKVARETL